MDSTNKIFAGLIALGFITCIAISYMFINQYKKQEVNLRPQSHPYNVCIKMFIEQADKKEVECDFEKAKSVCFDLIKSKGE